MGGSAAVRYRPAEGDPPADPESGTRWPAVGAHAFIVEPFRRVLEANGLATPAALMQVSGDRLVAWSRSSDAVEITLTQGVPAPLTVFVKRYYYATAGRRLRVSLRGAWLGRSRARREFDALRCLYRRSIPVPRPLAWAEVRRFGWLTCCAVVTEGIPGGRPLIEIVRGAADARGRWQAHPRMRRAVIDAVAATLRNLHDRRLAHGALFWRNIVIRTPGHEQVEAYLVDPEPPGGLWWPPRRRAAFDFDLACLDAIADALVHRTDRLRFYKAYRGIRRLESGDRRRIRRVLRQAHRLRAHERYRLSLLPAPEPCRGSPPPPHTGRTPALRPMPDSGAPVSPTTIS